MRIAALVVATYLAFQSHLVEAATKRQLPPRIYDEFESFVRENGGYFPWRSAGRDITPALRPPRPPGSARPSLHQPPNKQAPRDPKRSQATSQSSQVDHVSKQGGGGCETTEGFHFAGETWYPTGCRRRKCIHFRGKFFTETDSCDSEIHNTTYKCVVQVDITAQYPACCPRYRCNPDNLGNAV